MEYTQLVRFPSLDKAFDYPGRQTFQGRGKKTLHLGDCEPWPDKARVLRF